MNAHQEFWTNFNKNDHNALGIWAAECAEHVLPLFERNYPEDLRPRKAIETLREWIQTGMFSMSVIRSASLAAHAAAREVKDTDNDARFAARAAGQAVATAHVPTHALGPALYALKAIAATNPKDLNVAITTEREWQFNRVPENLKEWVAAGLKEKERLLPKNLRPRDSLARLFRIF